jgi:hypothetical protein
MGIGSAEIMPANSKPKQTSFWLTFICDRAKDNMWVVQMIISGSCKRFLYLRRFAFLLHHPLFVVAFDWKENAATRNPRNASRESLEGTSICTDILSSSSHDMARDNVCFICSTSWTRFCLLVFAYTARYLFAFIIIQYDFTFLF